VGRTMIVSRAHCHHVGDAPISLGADILAAAQVLAAHFKTALGADQFNLMSANGEKAEQSVQHLHFHYLPRFGDEPFSTWPRLPPFKTDLDDLHKKLVIDT